MEERKQTISLSKNNVDKAEVKMDYFSIEHRRRGSIDKDEERELDEYFSHSYQPLSNLPTPPSSSASSPIMGLSTSFYGTHFSLAPSTFLCTLVPQQRPNIEQVRIYLIRARLEVNHIALAACILDSLSSSFVRSWRKACEKARSPAIPTFRSNPLKAELIVLGALAVAQAYLEDTSGNTKWWAQISNNTLETRDIAATIRCILQDIDYGLMSFTMEDLEVQKQAIFEMGGIEVRRGRAILNGGQLTPDESPL